MPPKKDPKVDFRVRVADWIYDGCPITASSPPMDLLEQMEDERLLVISEYMAGGALGQSLYASLTARGQYEVGRLRAVADDLIR